MSDNLNDMVDSVEMDEVEVVKRDVPHCHDPDWVEFVMDQLADHELVKGSPTTDGLRRVCEQHFGRIVVSDSIPIDYCVERNVAVVKHLLEIARYDGLGKIVVSAVVNVVGNTLPATFRTHAEATACTRAEGKALRRAMKIRVATAEELISDGDDPISSDPITDQQILALKTLCKRLDVDLVALVKTMAKGAKNVKKVKNGEASMILNKLSEYQRDTPVPSKLQGYKEGWEEKFGGK